MLATQLFTRKLRHHNVGACSIWGLPMTNFADASNYPYRPGSLFLGLDDDGFEVGVETERHAITIAGAGSGKGACLLIPNARRWPHNLLVVDPKGENAAASWEAREALGQKVCILDPFKVAEVPERLRATVNLLADLDPNGWTVAEDIKAIADGLVKRSDPKHEEWDKGAVSLLAGLMAYVVAEAPAEKKTLLMVREMLTQPNAALYEDAQRMIACAASGGLAKAGGVGIMTAIESEKGMEKDFLAAARRHTEWMDSVPMQTILGTSSFSLSELKTGDVSVFLVLPPQYLDTHATFLRVFVRTAINAMAAGGSGKGKRCLFLLDEFFTLGRMDEIAKAAGLMRSYGVHLWPFLQDIGQLRTLYGPELSETFFGNSDAHIFFGNTDSGTLSYVSTQLGDVGTAELSAPPEKQAFQPKFWSETDWGELNAVGKQKKEEWDTKEENKHRQYQHEMSKVGKNRYPPDKVRSMVAKTGNSPVAKNMIVFAKGGDVLLLKLAPYFYTIPKSISPAYITKAETIPSLSKVQKPFYKVRQFLLLGLGIIFLLATIIGIANPNPSTGEPPQPFLSFVVSAGAFWLYSRERKKK